MTTKVDTGGAAAVAGNVDTGGGDFVGRDKNQINLIGAVSADQVEAVLPVLRRLLARQDTELCLDPEQQRLRLSNPAERTVVLSEEAAEALLPAAARQADPAAYLSAMAGPSPLRALGPALCALGRGADRDPAPRRGAP